MALMRPYLVKPEYSNFAQGFNEEDLLLQATIQAALAQPNSKPAALLHTIESHIDPRLLQDIGRELHLLDETLDFALEFEGARTQLVEMQQQKQGLSMLDALKEKPFSALTIDERDMLKNLTAKKS